MTILTSDASASADAPRGEFAEANSPMRSGTCCGCSELRWEMGHRARHPHLSAIRAASDAALDLLFPRRCPFCDRPVPIRPEAPFHTLACPECEQKVRRISPVRDALCCRCGKPLENAAAEYCGDCRRMKHAFTRGCAVYRFRDVAGPVYRMKYNGRAEYAEYFGLRMAERFREEFDPAGVDALVPIPLSKERLRKRGWNQAALLAKALGRQIGVPVREDLLQRCLGTEAMRGLGAEERRRELKRAFLFTGDDVKSKVYVLVDDIYTTGATMDACSRELLRAGAGGIFFITLSTGAVRDDALRQRRQRMARAEGLECRT